MDHAGQLVCLALVETDRAATEVVPLLLQLGQHPRKPKLCLGHILGSEAAKLFALAHQLSERVGTRLRSQKTPVFGCLNGRAIARTMCITRAALSLCFRDYPA